MTNKTNIYKFATLLGLGLLLACVKDKGFDPPPLNCAEFEVNSTYSDLIKRYQDETIQIQEDLIIEGYVVSSDIVGNFFSVLHFQDRPMDPTEGLQLEVDLRNSHLFYPEGSKIWIKLKGLYLGKSKGVFKLGGTFTSFGNVSIGRLPSAIIDQHVFLSCDQPAIVQPIDVSIETLQENQTSTLVRLSNVELIAAELGETFANLKEETERTLIDCNDNQITLVNSGFSDFQAELLPEGNGTITGVLLRENQNYLLAIRTLNDFAFTQERCQDVVDEFTSNTIFISELADPDNNSGARFVEFYNSADEALSLKGWQLRRYTNDNTDVSSKIDLSALVIGARRTLVVSPNAAEFEKVYGFSPDLGVGTNSPADTNGDDNLELVDPFGTVIDIFGVVGEDGSGTEHEFEDGRAVRNIDVTMAKLPFDANEWTIYNDSGGLSTINQPQFAPDDFSPGIR